MSCLMLSINVVRREEAGRSVGRLVRHLSVHAERATLPFGTFVSTNQPTTPSIQSKGRRIIIITIIMRAPFVGVLWCSPSRHRRPPPSPPPRKEKAPPPVPLVRALSVPVATVRPQTKAYNVSQSCTGTLRALTVL